MVFMHATVFICSLVGPADRAPPSACLQTFSAVAVQPAGTQPISVSWILPPVCETWAVACRAEDKELLRLVRARLRHGCACVGTGRADEGELAWRRFFAAYNPLIRRLVRASHIARADVDDCVQDVWLELVRKLSSFDYDPSRAPFAAWLTTLVSRKIAHILRHRAAPLVFNLDGHADLVPSSLPERDGVCETREARELLDKLLTELQHEVSRSTQELLRLRWLEGRTVAEAGTLLGMKPRQVWNREYRARHRLRQLLGQD